MATFSAPTLIGQILYHHNHMLKMGSQLGQVEVRLGVDLAIIPATGQWQSL